MYDLLFRLYISKEDQAKLADNTLTWKEISTECFKTQLSMKVCIVDPDEADEEVKEEIARILKKMKKD